MKHHTGALAGAVLLVGGWLAATGADAAPRAWVSSHGVDAPGCSAPTSPCRSFQYAHDQIVSEGGEIDVLDPGGYGAVTITKSITIVNDGVGLAGVVAPSGGTGITINAGPGDIVNLRGLTIAGAGVANEGVVFNSGAGLNVENCVVHDFIYDGIGLTPNVAATFNVQDTVISNIGDNAFVIEVLGSGKVTGSLTRVTARSANSGFNINGANGSGSLFVTIDHSDAIGNTYGVGVESVSGADTTRVMVFDTTISNNKLYGVFENGTGSTTYLARSALSGNATASIAQNGGVLDTFGDNYIAGNSDNGGALTAVATK